MFEIYWEKYGLMVDLILQYVTEINEIKIACLVWTSSVFERRFFVG